MTNSTNNVVHSYNFKPSEITFSKVKQNKHKGKFVFVNYNQKPLLLQLPKLRVPMGVSRWEDENGGLPKYEINVSFSGIEGDERIKATYENFNEFDKQMIKSALENSKEWFSGLTKPSEQLFETQYSKFVKSGVTENATYPDRLRLKFVRDINGTFDHIHVYNKNKERIYLTDDNIMEVFPKGCQAVFIIQAHNCWLKPKGEFGTVWRVGQAIVFHNEKPLEDFAFELDERDLEEKTEETTDKSEVPVNTPAEQESEEPQEEEPSFESELQELEISSTQKTKKTSKK